MAQIANPIKQFQFQIEIDGLLQFLVQKVTLPDAEVEKSTHGDTNHDVKTAGRVIIGDMVLEKLKRAETGDDWAWNWLMAAQNPITGGGSLAQNYKRTLVVREMDPTGTIAVNSYAYFGCWVTKVEPGDRDRNTSDNVIETITISVDEPARV